VIAAIASALTGKRTPEPAVPESLGDELAAAAAEAGFTPRRTCRPGRHHY
jgi:hypothetical protein